MIYRTATTEQFVVKDVNESTISQIKEWVGCRFYETPEEVLKDGIMPLRYYIVDSDGNYVPIHKGLIIVKLNVQFLYENGVQIEPEGSCLFTLGYEPKVMCCNGATQETKQMIEHSIMEETVELVKQLIEFKGNCTDKEKKQIARDYYEKSVTWLECLDKFKLILFSELVEYANRLEELLDLTNEEDIRRFIKYDNLLSN